MWYSLLHGLVSRTQEQVGGLNYKLLRHVNKGFKAVSLVLVECSKASTPLWLGSLRRISLLMKASRCSFQAGSLKICGEFIL